MLLHCQLYSSCRITCIYSRSCRWALVSNWIWSRWRFMNFSRTILPHETSFAPTQEGTWCLVGHFELDCEDRSLKLTAESDPQKKVYPSWLVCQCTMYESDRTMCFAIAICIIHYYFLEFDCKKSTVPDLVAWTLLNALLHWKATKINHAKRRRMSVCLLAIWSWVIVLEWMSLGGARWLLLIHNW